MLLIIIFCDPQHGVALRSSKWRSQLAWIQKIQNHPYNYVSKRRDYLRLPGMNTYSKVEINYHLRRVAVSESFRVPQ